MKKGFVAIMVVAMLFGFVACSDDKDIVTDLELEKTSFLITTMNLDSMRNPLQIKVKNVYPETATNKKVLFELVDADIVDDVTGKEVTYSFYDTDLQETISGTYKWSDFIEIDNSGVLKFKSFNVANSQGAVKRTDILTKVLKDTHTTFTVRAKSASNIDVYKDIVFSLNYDVPTTVEMKLKRNGTYEIDAKKNIELTTGETIKIELVFKENEYSGVKYAYVDAEGNVIDLELLEKEDGTKYYAVSTAAEFYPETKEYKALATDLTGTTLVIKNCEGTELTRLTPYINRINNAKELKAFLADNELTYTAGSREEQLKNASEGWLLNDVSVTAINSETTVKKSLNTNGKNITFVREKPSDPEFPIALNLAKSNGIVISANSSSISMTNTTCDSILINAGTKSVEISSGSFSAVASKTNTKATAIKTSGYLKIENATITAEANDEAIAIEANTSSLCSALNSVTATATGKNVTAVKVNYSTINGGSYTANAPDKAVALESSGTVEVYGLNLEAKNKDAKAKEAIAINVVADGLKIKNGEVVTSLVAKATDKAIALKTNNSVEINCMKMSVNSDKEAVGAYIDASSDDSVIITNVSDSSVSGKVAIGVYNYKSETTTLDNVKFSVVGEKTDNNVLEFKNTELTYAVAGIVNMSSMKVTGLLDLSVKNTNGLTTTKDYFGIYNTANGKIDFVANNNAAFNVTVNVTVANGGACALKNVGKISFTNVQGEFNASRINEAVGSSQMTTYALDNNDDTSLGITVKGGSLKFLAKSHNSSSGQDLENIVGYIFKEKLGTEEGTGYVTFSVDPSEK